MKNTKTGLFFGSFDPMHAGHLIIAEFLCSNTDIGRIWFVVSPQNPHKIHTIQTDSSQRIAMLRLAIEGDERFEVCDIEFQMPLPNYTYKTLELLRKEFPDEEFVLIIGGDNLEGFKKWKNYEEILNMIEVYVYPRNEFTDKDLIKHEKIKLIDAPRLEISSSYVRESFFKGKPAKYMLNGKVYEYILKEKLYTKDIK